MTVSVQAMPLGAFLRHVSNEANVSIVANSSLDEKPVTVDVVDVPVSDVLGVVARRLGVQLTRTGNLFYLGDLKPEDRGVLVRRMLRLSADEWKLAITTLMSEHGRASVYEDGLAVIADRVEVLQRVIEMIDRVEAAPTDTWVLQLSIISLAENDVERFGVEVEPLLDVAANFAANSATGIAANGASLAVGLRAVLDWVKSSERSNIVAQPLIVVSDGRKARLTDGRKFPIAKRTVSSEGTVTVTGFEFIETGLTVEATLREDQPGRARLGLSVTLSEVVGVVADEAPITIQSVVDTSAVIESGGVYLLGSVERDSSRRQLQGGLSTVDAKNVERNTMQVWGRAFRIAGPPGTK